MLPLVYTQSSRGVAIGLYAVGCVAIGLYVVLKGVLPLVYTQSSRGVAIGLYAVL